MTGFRGAIFDVDGVLVDSPHEQAWRESLQQLMEGPWRDVRRASSWAPDAFTSLVYQQEVAGKPREAGARAALAYFGVPGDDAHVQEYAARKQNVIAQLIDEGRFVAYPDAVRFLVAVKGAGIRAAAASSSKNATRLLERIRPDAFANEPVARARSIPKDATLRDLFEVDVSGRDFPHGKPHPDMFLTAAEELGVEPASAFVVEDSPAGVLAARAGSMAAIGVARSGDAELLGSVGATIVVTTLDDIDRDELAHGRLATRAHEGRFLSK